MKKIFGILLIFIFAAVSVRASEIPKSYAHERSMQNKISNIGFKLLNANKINKRMIFVYAEKPSKINIDKSFTKKQVIIFDKTLNFADNDDELAAMLALSIGRTIESHNGFLNSMYIKSAPKKFQILYDKRAADYMTKAGYNPIALITFMNKAYPEKQGIIKGLRSNKTSKRLADIYEYIYFNYPYYLKNNPYLYSESYQNFLLHSSDSRALLMNKIKSNSKERLKYE